MVNLEIEIDREGRNVTISGRYSGGNFVLTMKKEHAATLASVLTTASAFDQDDQSFLFSSKLAEVQLSNEKSSTVL